MLATITYCPNGQKTPGYYDNILTPEILSDICLRVTGQPYYILGKDNSIPYNRGRLVYIEYHGCINYISLSEDVVNSRNSSVQSVPTAINMFYADKRENKRLYYYFIPHEGNLFTDYHMFIYKMLLTAGVTFLNLHDYYHTEITSYKNVDELIANRNENRKTRSANNSSYISKTSETIQIYAKVFGANKYESTLLALAISNITDRDIELFHICEKELSRLPKPSLKTLSTIKNLSIFDTSMTLEKRKFLEQEDKNSLRSPTYQYNLHKRLGHKRCALCGCEIPEIIHGAHIWGVADIAKSEQFNNDEKFNHAINGHNGLWLCQNHHKLFDSNIIIFDSEGHAMASTYSNDKNTNFIREITTRPKLETKFMTDDFLWYLSQRNCERNFNAYQRIIV